MVTWIYIERGSVPETDDKASRSDADVERLRGHVAALEGPRHPRSSPAELQAAEDYVAEHLGALGIATERRAFQFGGAEFQNVVGIIQGTDPDRPRVLVGAHFDSVASTPGADDNASGVAALIETARLLAHRALKSTVEFVGFNLEEAQGVTYRVGSRRYASEAKRRGVGYAGALILEMVGYTDTSPGSQRVPALLFWKRVPRTGTFLAATGDRRSARLLRRFARTAATCVPDLAVITFRSPFRGWVVPHTRLSDNASFWDVGYPSLMLTDTARGTLHATVVQVREEHHSAETHQDRAEVDRLAGNGVELGPPDAWNQVLGEERDGDRFPRGDRRVHESQKPARDERGPGALNLGNTRRSRSGCAAGRSAYDPRWARSATRTTTRSARASSRRSSASFSTANVSRRRPRRRWPSSTSSRASTTRAGGTPLSAKSRRSTSNAAMPGRPPRERPLRPVLYSPASRGKLPSPSGEGCSENLSVHPSTKAGQLH